MRRQLRIKEITFSIFALIGLSVSGQVQLNQLEGFGVAIYDINNSGQGIHGNGYYDFATNSSSTTEAGVMQTVALNDANQVLGLVDDGAGGYAPAYRNEGVWSSFPTTTFDPATDYTLYDISENGIWVVGQTGWTPENGAWGFIYNTQTEEFTLLSSDLYEYGAAYGVNNNGIAVGWVDDLPVGTVRMPAYFSADGTITLIQVSYGEANGINENNQVVGYVDGAPFIYNINAGELTTFSLPADFMSATFADISDNGVAIGYAEMAGFSRRPIIYHPDLGTDPLLLGDVLTQYGIDASGLIGTGYRISSDGNYVCGWGDGPAFLAPGWAVFFDDLLLAESECTLNCPGNIVVDAPLGATGVVVGYGISYSCEGDDPDGTEVVLVNGLPSGAEFPIGTTTVYHELRDGEGNVLDSCSFTVTVNDAYCNSSYNGYVEPITYVGFAGIDNTTSAGLGASPQNEYFLDITGTVQQGETYPIVLEGNTGGEYTDYFTVYIDWDQDGTFSTTERYPIGSLTNSTGEDGQQLTGEIAVPVDATLGATRMRIVKNWDSSPMNSCGEYDYGQTEDYTLLVGLMGASDLNGNGFTYYPNPVKDYLNIHSSKTIESVSVYNLAGQAITSQAKAIQGKINMGNLPEGVYVVRVAFEGGRTETFKVIKK